MRALQEESGARIVVDKYGDPHADQKTLIIHGKKKEKKKGHLTS